MRARPGGHYSGARARRLRTFCWCVCAAVGAAQSLASKNVEDRGVAVLAWCDKIWVCLPAVVGVAV